ncbi:hypothetical protein DVH24_033588 [Malus domestica]|uniref:B-like cyclin n=1 Tax=Malus domestica TaxID=3750 RepID=A0A498JG26_MALDO|nr:hypothetical protein DVH24_033588 [Malus domestica]
MAPSFDCAVSSLLCAEENIFDIDDFGSEEAHRNHRNNSRKGGFCDDGEEGLPLQSQSDEYLGSMVEKEFHHLPASDYLMRLQSGDLDLAARQQAVDWIGKANAHFSFGPLCQYLSINYLDRFLSAYELPNGKAWTMQLLAVACLSLAAKMEEIDVPISHDLQVVESKFVFEARTIQRMELLVLSALRWRMQAVTPFTFIDSFLLMINDDQTNLKTSILRSSHLIVTTAKGTNLVLQVIICVSNCTNHGEKAADVWWKLNAGIDSLEYRPSEVAAAVAISVAGEAKTLDNEKAISMLIQHVHLVKERVAKCVNLIHDMTLMSGTPMKEASGSAQSGTQSPIGVLDAGCFSYKSEETTVGSCVNSFHSSSDSKRRKLNRPCEVCLDDMGRELWEDNIEYLNSALNNLP